MGMDAIKQTIISLSQGNPGCAMMLGEVVWKTDAKTFLTVCRTLYQRNIFGNRAYMLWNDACDRDTPAFVELVEKINAGKLPIDVVNAHLAEGRCRPFTADKETP